MKKTILLSVLLVAALVSVAAAGLSVPEFAILTNGRVNDAGLFVLSTRMNIDLLVEGGAKFAAWFKLGFSSPDLEGYLASLYEVPDPLDPLYPDNTIALLAANRGFTLQTAAVRIDELFGSPLELTVFAGRLDEYCSGNDFPLLFGTKPFSTKLKGFMYYPEGIGGDRSRWYDGLHTAYGTGMRLSLAGESLRTYLYLYQDLWLGLGNWSADARVLLNSDQVKLEAFAGGSFPVSEMGVYRAGLLFFYDTGAVGDFYAQVGIPRWDPTEPFGPELLYFMFEPRIDFGFGALTLSLFFHPAYYLQAETSEAGNMDMRVDLSFGNLDKTGIKWGDETLIAYAPESAVPLTVETSLYAQSVLTGVRIDTKLTLRAFPFPEYWYGMFMPYLGLTTSF